MVERRDRAPLGVEATFFTADRPAAGATVSLDEEAAHHARVRRVDVGHRVRLLDGAGSVAYGTLVRLAKSHMQVEVQDVEHQEPGAPVHMLVPVADRDRMLWMAEKCAELGAASWRPVLWRRSRSVSPRGEGMTFHARVRSRMIGALEQSGNAWLPTMFPEATLERAIASAPRGVRCVLEAGRDPILGTEIASPFSLAVGPEGGIEPDELHALEDAGWLPVSLGDTTLRFETAAIAGLAVVRAALDRAPEGARG